MSEGLRARLFHRYWRRRFRAAKDSGAFLATVRRRQATLEGFAMRAEARLAEPEPAPPPGAVWTHRPAALLRPVTPSALSGAETGAGFGPDLTLHHDCGPAAALLLSQRRAGRGALRFSLLFEAYELGGAFASFSLSVPERLRRPSVGEALRLDLDIDGSRPVKAFLRIVVSGPGKRAELGEEGEVGLVAATFRFDVSRAAFPLREDDRLWVDVILDRPRMTSLTIRDLALSLVPG